MGAGGNTGGGGGSVPGGAGGGVAGGFGGGTGGGISNDRITDTDCPDPQSFYCDVTLSRCVVTSPQAPFFRLPAAPGTFVDRTLLHPGGGDAKLRAEVLRLQLDQSGPTVSLTALVEHDAIDLDDLISTAVAFSVVEQR